MRRVKTQSQAWLYSPRRMGYRTLFYAAFVCAYACCLSAGTTRPVLAPSRGRAGSRTCLGRSRGDSNFQLLRVDPFLCRGLDLGSDPSVCIPRSTFVRRAGAPKSDCRSSDWIKRTEAFRETGWQVIKTNHLWNVSAYERRTRPGSSILNLRLCCPLR